MNNHPISCYHLGRYFQLDGKQLQEQYKEHISDYSGWGQKGHADQWMLFSKNVSPRLSIDETALSNGDTLKQLLARSRYLLFKHHGKWTNVQSKRAELLFERYPELKKAYELSLRLGEIFKVCKSKEQAFKRLALWHNDVEECGMEAFKTVSRSIQAHYLSILNFFINRSTNASAESSMLKLKQLEQHQEM